MSLVDLIRRAAPLAEIAAYLDAAPPDRRHAECLALGRADQRRLFALASPAIDLAHFVPASVAPLTPVRHDGQNTLPLPAPIQRFAKLFARPAGGDPDRLFGYNDSPTRPLIGPGFFVARPTHADPSWRARGAVVVDYFQVPDGPVPAAWPRVVPNSRGLQFFVYRNTRDFMRRVSADVSIGAAYRHETPLDHYFVLVRG